MYHYALCFVKIEWIWWLLMFIKALNCSFIILCYPILERYQIWPSLCQDDFYDSRPFLFYNIYIYIIRILKVCPWYWNICRYYIFNIKNWCICTFKIVCETLIYHIISRYIYIKHCTLKKDVCLNFFKPHEFDLFLPILSIF